MAELYRRQYGNITVVVDDEFIRGVSDEEMAARRKELNDYLSSLLAKPGRRERLYEYCKEKYGGEKKAP